jgi:hypothetical protein
MVRTQEHTVTDPAAPPSVTAFTYGNMPYMRKTTVYLPDALKERLERAARDGNISEAELIRSAIDDYTRTSARPRPRLPLFESIGDPDLAGRVDEILEEGFGRD